MLKLSDISFKYDGNDTDILKGVSFDLEQGKVLAVVGPSGGGKSTLLRVIAGLEKPYAGHIDVSGQVHVDDRTFVKPEKRAIGMVFQDYALFPHMTVQKNIEYGITHKSKREKSEIVEEMLKLVDLPGYGKRYPHELSGGQQQRIALARALAPKPSLLLLDEPFSNLDTQLLEQVRNDLFEIIKKADITSIMVTHNPKDAEERADVIMEIRQGVSKILK